MYDVIIPQRILEITQLQLMYFGAYFANRTNRITAHFRPTEGKIVRCVNQNTTEFH